MVQVTIVALISAIIIIYLKSINSELTVLALIGAGIIVLSFAFSYLNEVFAFFDKLVELSGIGKTTFSIIFKITAIGYLIEFGAGTIEDMGLPSLASKLILVGKIIIVSVSLPIFYAIFNMFSGLIK